MLAARYDDDDDDLRSRHVYSIFIFNANDILLIFFLTWYNDFNFWDQTMSFTTNKNDSLFNLRKIIKLYMFYPYQVLALKGNSWDDKKLDIKCQIYTISS